MNRVALKMNTDVELTVDFDMMIVHRIFNDELHCWSVYRDSYGVWWEKNLNIDNIPLWNKLKKYGSSDNSKLVMNKAYDTYLSEKILLDVK